MTYSISELTEAFNKAQDIFKEYVLQEAWHINKRLFLVKAQHNELYNLFMEGCTEAGLNPIYKESPFHECSSCKHFFNTVGNVVVITKEYKNDHAIYTKESIFHKLAITDNVYQKIFKKIEEHVLSKEIVEPAVFPVNTIYSLNEAGYEVLEDGTRIRHNHFYVDLSELPDEYINNKARKVKGIAKTNAELLSKLDKSYLPDIETLVEIVSQTGLYRADSKLGVLVNLQMYLEELSLISPESYELCVYYNSFMVRNNHLSNKYIYDTNNTMLSQDGNNYLGVYEPHFLNTTLGVLLQNIHDGMDVNVAISKYLDMVSAENYQRPKKIITQSMINQAEKKITELDFLDSIPRRFATMDDIPLKEIQYINKNNTAHEEGSIFDELRKETPNKPVKNVEHIELIHYNKFKDMKFKNIELYIDPEYSRNFVSLIAPVNKDSKNLFKWDNNFSWSYVGNLADTSIKENVKKAGGSVNGVLRFSLQWNDEDHYNSSDLDAHCTCNLKNLTINRDDSEIYYLNKWNFLCKGGGLDIDIIDPKKDVPAVENIIFPKLENMEAGTYKFRVHMFSRRTEMDNFKCEIEFDDKVYSYEYRQDMVKGEYIDIATVTLDDDNKFSIEHHLPVFEDYKSTWGCKTYSFVPVKAIMDSPNYWEDNHSGLKHIFFFLQDCINHEQPMVWYNEFLCSELHDEKKVMNILASQVKVPDDPNQLSGIGVSKESILLFKCDGDLFRVFMNPNRDGGIE